MPSARRARSAGLTARPPAALARSLIESSSDCGQLTTGPPGQPRAAHRKDITTRDAFVIVIAAAGPGRNGVGRCTRARQGRSQVRLCNPGEMTSQRPLPGTGQVPMLRDEWREPLRALRDPIAGDGGRARGDRDRSRRWRKQSWLGRFVSTYGWRAYALPVLAVVTGVVVYQAVGSRLPAEPAQMHSPLVGQPTIDGGGTAIIGAPPKGLTEYEINWEAGVLPEGGKYTEAGDKTWHI